tara:strand:- start:929 stop:1321 length:393 start_codon:yes stop_codon:yes gene_type:complete
MKKFLIIFSIGLCGCSMHNLKFNSTSSLCLDGMFANFIDAKCKDIVEQGSWGKYTDQDTLAWEFQCVEPKRETEWTSMRYIIVQPGKRVTDRSLEPICGDMSVIVLTPSIPLRSEFNDTNSSSSPPRRGR